jgi:hypothetical protein
LIVATGTITINGAINSRGGGDNRGGSGGGVRLVSDVLTGTGGINATGGYYGGADGRIRVEANTATLGGTVSPAPSTLVPCGNTPVIWPADTIPRLVVTQVGGVGVPSDPRAVFAMGSQDVTLTSTTPVKVRLQGTNVPLDWIVEVRLIPKSGDQTIAPATNTGGTVASSTWEATVTLPHGLTGIQARARKP